MVLDGAVQIFLILRIGKLIFFSVLQVLQVFLFLFTDIP